MSRVLIKIIKQYLLPLALLVLARVVNSAEPVAAEFSVGHDYQQLSLAAEDAPDIELFYWYGDPSSFQVDSMLEEYLKLHPALSVTRTPVVARLSWRAQAYIDPLLTQLEPFADQLPQKSEIYQACITDCEVFKDFPSIVSWLSKFVDEEEMDTVELRDIWRAEKQAEMRAKKFAIWQVPTILVKGRYLTNGKMIRSPMRLTGLLDYLLRDELGKQDLNKP